jgi:transcription elongation factor GreA
MTGSQERPIVLTARGRARLEERLQGWKEQLETLQAPPVDEPEDVGDQSIQLEGDDDISRLADMIAALQLTLDRAEPLAAGPEDGVVRQGSTVMLRDDQGQEQRVQLVDGAEVESDLGDVSLDSPVGQAILGHAAGDQVSVHLPSGERRLTLVSVEPYRPMSA